MALVSRRRFVKDVGITVGVTGAAGSSAAAPGADYSSGCAAASDEVICLSGAWQFRLDAENAGEKQNWQASGDGKSGWETVTVPHTWQTVAATSGYLGVAWYRKAFDAPASWREKFVRVEFEAAYHSATVWLNGTKVGEHLRKGYTAFTLDLSSSLRIGTENVLIVRVDNAFDSKMLPRDNSFDWTTDGGITRPVSLLVSPRVFIERLDVDAVPDSEHASAAVEILCLLRNSSNRSIRLTVEASVSDEDSGRIVARQSPSANLTINAGETRAVSLPSLTLSQVRLWHFDRPQLYRAHVKLTAGTVQHTRTSTFGVRRLEVREGGFYLNGERVWLMGVERMAGSNPEFGMAEPASWIEHDHHDMKELNCVLTRVHWQQDHRVLDYCDRHGIMIQVEVPSWGAATFKGMTGEPSAEIMQNGIEQLREMIGRDRNHPCIFAWGLCNEIGGQNPPAYQFAKTLYEQAKKLDPHRLRSYASNSLQSNPARDVAAVMDFVEWNEYYESWYQGDVESVRKNLAEISRAFPGKPIVISEYGYCECDPRHTGGDERRIEVLRTHTGVYREFENVAGAIFFCYNDYRTHIGDKGRGVLKQRVHGVVDLFGARKKSYEDLRLESSPVELFIVEPRDAGFVVSIRTRKKLPSYALEGYSVRFLLYGFGDLPMEQEIKALSKLLPGSQISVGFMPSEKSPRRVRVDLLRPTGFSAAAATWH